MKKPLEKSNYEFNTLNEIKVLLTNAKSAYWTAAKILYDVRERKGYKELGYDTLEDYCEDGLHKSRQTVTQLLKAYEVAVIQCKMDPETLPEYSKVYLVSEMMEQDPEHAQEWINKAEELTSRDLRDEKKEAKTGIRQMDCQHPDEIIIVLRQCPICGNKQRDFEAEERLKNQNE